MNVRAPAVPAVTLFVRGPFQAGGVVLLDEDEAHHLKVRRVPDGGTVRLVDGRGGVATARVGQEGAQITVRVVATTTVPPPPVTELLVGAGDRERFLDLAEKATEMGATRLVPLLTGHAQAVATRIQAVHIEKAQRRAREALKQSGGAWVPTVVAPVAFAEALRGGPPGVLRFVADGDGGPMPAVREADAVQWAVGPEGGFSDAESAALKGAGYRPVALGRATLRFDTAALAALAVTAQARLG